MRGPGLDRFRQWAGRGRRLLGQLAASVARIRGTGEGRADTRTVVITTTAMEIGEDGTLGPRRIWLEGEDADLFLESLPVYTPVLEES